MPEVMILNGAMENDEDFGFDEKILRGTIDQTCFKNLNTDWYQRVGGFSDHEIRELIDLCLAKKKVEDICIGMRGERYKVDGTTYTLLDKLYIINGVQRWTAAKLALMTRPDLIIRLGCKIYFNTTAAKENEMFCAMNSTQQRIAPSVLIRNKYQTSPAAAAVYDVCANKKFVLFQRVGWNQKLIQGEDINGMSLAKIAGALHTRFGSVPSGRAYDVLAGLEKACEKTTQEGMKTNIIEFFRIVNDCWNLTGKRSPALNQDFLIVLGKLLASYDCFWDAESLFMPDKYMKKLMKIDVETIQESIRTLKKSNINKKDAFFEMLRQKLGLDPFSKRRVTASDVKSTGKHA